MATTLAEQLANVEAAIVKAEAAQRGAVDGVLSERPDLAVLYKRKDQLDLRIARAAHPRRSVAEF